MLKVKQGSCEYQLLKSFDMIRQGNEPRSTYCKADALTKGGAKDTKLEANAKDTKKIQGQGNTFRGQTLSRPRQNSSVLQRIRSSKIFSHKVSDNLFA